TDAPGEPQPTVRRSWPADPQSNVVHGANADATTIRLWLWLWLWLSAGPTGRLQSLLQPDAADELPDAADELLPADAGARLLVWPLIRQPAADLMLSKGARNLLYQEDSCTFAF